MNYNKIYRKHFKKYGDNTGFIHFNPRITRERFERIIFRTIKSNFSITITEKHPSFKNLLKIIMLIIKVIPDKDLWEFYKKIKNHEYFKISLDF